MNYYNEIKENLIKCDIYDQVKDYSKNRNRVITYYENGRILKEAGKEYGKNIIKQYSERLMIEVGKKYNERTLYRMRKFYEVFSNEKLTPMVSKLSWSHYIILITLNNENEILYYINTCLLHNYNKRQLQERIKNKEYYRLPETTMKKLMDKETLEISDLVPNPIIIKSNTNNNELSDYAKAKGIKLNFIKIDSLEKAKNAPCIFNNWANFYKGKFISNTILNANAFEKLIK